jgi:hypothetical protein
LLAKYIKISKIAAVIWSVIIFHKARLKIPKAKVKFCERFPAKGRLKVNIALCSGPYAQGNIINIGNI